MAFPRFLLLLSALFTLVTPPARAEEPGFALTEPPAWVEPTLVDVARPMRAEEAVSGLHLLLSERQVHISQETTETFVRAVRRVASSRGVAEGSELRVRFSPGHQRLRLHGIWRTRDGVRTQLLRAEDVKLIQQERELDSGIYSDERTAVVFLQDVRVGDLLEESYSLEGRHPLFREHHVDALSLASRAPVARLVHRLLAPAGLALQFKVHGTSAEPTVRERDGLREYRWERADVPAVTEEDGVPSDVQAWPYVQVSSFPSWATVAAWGLALQEGLPGSAEVTALAESWRALPTEEARFLAAVRFVQDEVRYLGIELGPNTHQPHPPGQVLAQRFGDCKDKALLLATLLRTLGIPAHLALVDSDERGGVAHLLPSPGVFDHVIVRAQVAGRTEWVDATRTYQRGRLGARAPLPYARALVLAPGTSGLEPIPEPAPEGPELDVRYTLSVDDAGQGTLAVTSRFSRAEADSARSVVAGLSAEQLASRQLDRRRSLFPKLRPEGAPRIVDDEAANWVTLEERYALEDAWAGGALRLAISSMNDELALPHRTEGRAFPLEVSHPTLIRERWEVHTGHSRSVAANQHTVEGPASRLRLDVHPESSGFVYEVEYQSLADRVSPDGVARHVEAVRKMHSLLGMSVPAPVGALSSSSESPQLSRAASLAISLVVLLVVAAFWLELPQRLRRFVRERRSRRPAPPPVRHLREGAEDAAPLLVDSLEQAELRLLRQHCTCGGALARVPDGLQLLRTGSGGHSLTVLRARCTTCGTSHTRTFDVRPN